MVVFLAEQIARAVNRLPRTSRGSEGRLKSGKGEYKLVELSSNMKRGRKRGDGEEKD